MNHLAHVVLAGPDPDHRLGAFLGDHVRGRAALEAMPPALARGVMLHRKIDSWSDAYPAVTALRARTRAPWRRYSGVIFDVLFDCMLARNWSQYVAEPLDDFARRIDGMLAARRAELPARLARFSIWASANSLWTRHDERAMLDEIFARLAERHSRRGPLASGTELLDRLDPEIERAFHDLFPWLQARAVAFRDSPLPGRE